jgi:hypothetical protein
MDRSARAVERFNAQRISAREGDHARSETSGKEEERRNRVVAARSSPRQIRTALSILERRAFSIAACNIPYETLTR